MFSSSLMMTMPFSLDNYGCHDCCNRTSVAHKRVLMDARMNSHGDEKHIIPSNENSLTLMKEMLCYSSYLVEKSQYRI